MQRPSVPVVLFAAIMPALVLVDIVLKVTTDGIAHKPIIPHVFALQSTHNPSTAFGLLTLTPILLVGMIFMLTVGSVAAWWFMGRRHRLAAVAFAFFIAGAVGNLYDRIVYGYVRDFMRLTFWETFPIFNFADLCLTVGCILLCVHFVLVDRGGKDAV